MTFVELYTTANQICFVAGSVVLLLGTPAILAFPPTFALRSRWKATLAGRNIFYMSLGLAFICVLALVTRISAFFVAGADFVTYAQQGADDFFGRGILSFAVYFYAVYTFWRQYFGLLRYQMKGSKRAQEAGTLVSDTKVPSDQSS